jgi:hypothetical protein
MFKDQQWIATIGRTSDAAFASVSPGGIDQPLVVVAALLPDGKELP